MNVSRAGLIKPALIAGAVAVALAGCTASEPGADAAGVPSAPPASSAPESSPSAASEPTSEYSPEEVAAIEDAKDAVLRFNDAQNAAYSDPQNAGPETFEAVAIGSVKDGELNTLRNLKEQGLHQTGESEVTFTKVKSVETESDPDALSYPKVVFDICYDNSEIDLVDETGQSVMGEGDDVLTGLIAAYEEPDQGWFIDHLTTKEGGCQP